jgi:hypothetical protein
MLAVEKFLHIGSSFFDLPIDDVLPVVFPDLLPIAFWINSAGTPIPAVLCEV